MPLEPPPRIVDKFEKIWRDWLHFFWDLVNSHTGGSSPTPPVTGTNWNAHGNTALGTDTNPLAINGGAFLVTDPSGFSGTPPDGEVPAAIEIENTSLAFIPSKWGAIRAGTNSADQWSDANIGILSVGFGYNAIASGIASIAMGDRPEASGTTSIAIGGGNPVATQINAICIGTLGSQATASATLAIGKAAKARATDSVAIGFQPTTDGGQSVAIGYVVSTAGQFGIAIGSNADAIGLGSVALGSIVQTTGIGSVAIGTGASTFAQQLNNTKADSMWMAVKSDLPTFILDSRGGGPGTTGFIGIVEQDPLSTLDIGGSVGFKYTNITAVSGNTHTIGASDDEYTFRVDMSPLTFAQVQTIQLPQITSTATDRRIYYFKAVALTTVPGAAANLQIKPNTADRIENWPGGQGQRLVAGAPLAIDSGTSITIIANNTDKTWWVI